MRPNHQGPFLRQVLPFSLLSGCFISVVSLAVTVALELSGLFPLASIGHMIRLMPVILAASCIPVMLAGGADIARYVCAPQPVNTKCPHANLGVILFGGRVRSG